MVMTVRKIFYPRRSQLVSGGRDLDVMTSQELVHFRVSMDSIAEAQLRCLHLENQRPLKVRKNTLAACLSFLCNHCSQEFG
jgi:hypothetical protein